jgi:UDP:flavonoid glycosyltransferase YjiC (YdhE family)
MPDSVPHPLIDRITAAPCKNALFHAGWFDQIGTLTHPSISFFLSHGGWSSIGESIVAGVPMMTWPLAHNDQAVSAARLSTREKPLAF